MEQLAVVVISHNGGLYRASPAAMWYFGPYKSEAEAERFCWEMCVKWCKGKNTRLELRIAVLHEPTLKAPGKLVTDSWSSMYQLSDNTRDQWRKIKKTMK
jgi:hypothetical protein